MWCCCCAGVVLVAVDVGVVLMVLVPEVGVVWCCCCAGVVVSRLLGSGAFVCGVVGWLLVLLRRLGCRGMMFVC